MISNMRRPPGLALMLQGTGSDVGKTLLVAGLCRLAARRGLSVRPFKPQNMSNNAAVAFDPVNGGAGEIGRAQWLQALACGIPPSTDMNPVLIKPDSDTGAQLIVQGQVAGRAEAKSYQTLKGRLLPAVLESFQRLKAEADLVIVEGAGSPAEINLRDRDIANMGFAEAAGVPVVLVGDIDRGGVIAALAGTHLILPENDRALIKGFIINKFRGDLSLFDEGLAAITRFTGWPSFGVAPWIKAASLLPSEDGVILERRRASSGASIKIAVPMLSRIANFDDLDPLAAEPGVEVVFVAPGQRIPGDARIIIIPGTKSTIADLAMLRAQGWADDIAAYRARGGSVVGLCGGYQMLGRTIADPDGAEGQAGEAAGLELLDVETVLAPQKIVRLASGRAIAGGAPVSGYEIHIGRTFGPDCARPLFELANGPDGAMSADGKVMGAYLHGVFGSDAFRRTFLAGFGHAATGGSYHDGVLAALDAVADALEQSLDIEGLFALAR